MSCSEIIALIDVIITSLLTGVIIWQAFKLNKSQQQLEERLNRNQSELQEKLNQSQIEMQQRQLKLDVYEYRRSVYLAITRIFSAFSVIESFFKKANIKTVKPMELVKLVDKEFNEVNRLSISESLKESKHLFNNEIFEKINSVDIDFELIMNCIYIIKHYKRQDSINKDDDKFLQSLSNMSVDSIHAIIREKDELIMLLDDELDVSNLEK